MTGTRRAQTGELEGPGRVNEISALNEGQAGSESASPTAWSGQKSLCARDLCIGMN